VGRCSWSRRSRTCASSSCRTCTARTFFSSNQCNPKCRCKPAPATPMPAPTAFFKWRGAPRSAIRHLEPPLCQRLWHATLEENLKGLGTATSCPEKDNACAHATAPITTDAHETARAQLRHIYIHIHMRIRKLKHITYTHTTHKYTHTHTHAHTHTQPSKARTHTHTVTHAETDTHAHTGTRTHRHTHTRTHTHTDTQQTHVSPSSAPDAGMNTFPISRLRPASQVRSVAPCICLLDASLQAAALHMVRAWSTTGTQGLNVKLPGASRRLQPSVYGNKPGATPGQAAGHQRKPTFFKAYGLLRRCPRQTAGTPGALPPTL